MDLGGRIDALAGADPARRRALRTLASAFDPAFEWRLMRGHRAVSGLWLTDESIRTQYVHLTDVLIGVLLDGGHDTALFLDKSGRPVAWMVDRFWPVLAPTFDEAGAVSGWPARPALRFLNIDRLQWRDHLDPLGTGAINATGLPSEVADDLRRALLQRPGDAALEGEALHAAPTFLTGRSVLVIDEVRVGGSTVEIACGMLGRALPRRPLRRHPMDEASPRAGPGRQRAQQPAPGVVSPRHGARPRDRRSRPRIRDAGGQLAGASRALLPVSAAPT